MNEQSIKLENGATLLYSQKESYFTYSKFHFNVGSNDEKDSTRGCAHLLEHMMFNGTNKYPRGKVEEIIDECGGDFNACTSEYYTRYYGNVLKDDTNRLFNVLADMCFAPLLKEDDFNTEKEIVIQELHDRNDDVWNYSFDSYFYKCFGSFPTVGSELSVRGMSYSDFIDFYKTYYNYQNLVISIVSPLDFDDILLMMQKTLSKYDVPTGVKNNNKYEIKNVKTEVKDMVDNLDQSKLLTGFLIPKGLTDMSDLYTQILGGGMTSRLFKNLREDKKLCYSVFSYTYDIGEMNYIGIGISFNNLDKYDEILYNCIEEINGMNKISVEEFNRAKRVNFAELCKVDEDRAKFSNALLNRYKNNLPLLTDERIAKLESISIEDFQNFAEKYCINQQLYTYLLYDDKNKNLTN